MANHIQKSLQLISLQFLVKIKNPCFFDTGFFNDLRILSLKILLYTSTTLNFFILNFYLPSSLFETNPWYCLSTNIKYTS